MLRPPTTDSPEPCLQDPVLKEGTGYEFCRLHDTVQQHLRALKAMAYEPSGPFIMSVLELKLDSNTCFEWQKFSQDMSEVLHFEKLLEFLDLRTQASEALPSDTKKHPLISILIRAKDDISTSLPYPILFIVHDRETCSVRFSTIQGSHA